MRFEEPVVEDPVVEEPGPGPEVAVGFVACLRQAGVAVATDATIRFVEALDAIEVARASQVYWAGRATLVSNHDDVGDFDRVFRQVFKGMELDSVAPLAVETTLVLDDLDALPDQGEPGEAPPGDQSIVRYSPAESLSDKDFAACTPDELAEAWALLAQVDLVGATRKSRRLVRAGQVRGAPDLRATVRAALRTGGEPIRRHHRRPSTRPRRVVLLIDVSGSMEPYARALVRFGHVAVAGGARTEAFAVGTRLTRLTRQLTGPDPDRALAAAAAAVVDWGGGTRLGEGLRVFNDEWGVRGMARGAIVVVLSDGWDRGEPELLAEQMARLSRVAHRIVWVNPLQAGPGYEPLARGMAAALPYVDDFVPGHSVSSLAAIAEVVAA